MSVNDVCDCIKNDIVGLKSSMLSSYVHDVNEYNISGRVLATCELDELKQVCVLSRWIDLCFFFFFLRKVLSMTFGDWVLFHNWVETKRDAER